MREGPSTVDDGKKPPKAVVLTERWGEVPEKDVMLKRVGRNRPLQGIGGRRTPDPDRQARRNWSSKRARLKLSCAWRTDLEKMWGGEGYPHARTVNVKREIGSGRWGKRKECWSNRHEYRRDATAGV